MATYGSSYYPTGNQGFASCGYAILIATKPDITGDVHLTIDGSNVTFAPVAWNMTASQTACDVAAAINSYSSIYTASCAGDTIFVCVDSLGSAANGDVVTTGASHDPDIGVTASNLSGGVNHTLIYHMVFEHGEHDIYGSSRLGVIKHVDSLAQRSFTAQVTTQSTRHLPIKGQFVSVNAVGSIENYDSPVVVKKKKTLPSTSGTIDAAHVSEVTGMKTYEYTNHLGNVLMTTNDKRLPLDSNSNDIIDGYAADVRSWSDYYPYGMLSDTWFFIKKNLSGTNPAPIAGPMVGRNTNLSDYRFGYQGSEMDNEHKGNGNSYTTYFRQHDPRLGRWFSVDPVVQPWQSPYTSMDNNPILLNDPMGDKAPKTLSKGFSKKTRGLDIKSGLTKIKGKVGSAGNKIKEKGGGSGKVKKPAESAKGTANIDEIGHFGGALPIFDVVAERDIPIGSSEFGRGEWSGSYENYKQNMGFEGFSDDVVKSLADSDLKIWLLQNGMDMNTTYESAWDKWYKSTQMYQADQAQAASGLMLGGYVIAAELQVFAFARPFTPSVATPKQFTYSSRYHSLRSDLTKNLYPVNTRHGYFSSPRPGHGLYNATTYRTVIRSGQMHFNQGNGTYRFLYNSRFNRYELGVRPDGGIIHSTRYPLK